MTLLTWPDTLPRPRMAGYAFTPGDTRRFAQSDGGAPRVGRGRSKAADLARMTIRVNAGQRARFDRFFFDEIGRGFRTFLMPDPTKDGWPILTDEGVPLLTDEGVPLLQAETWLCMFGQTMPGYGMENARFTISFEVMVLP